MATVEMSDLTGIATGKLPVSWVMEWVPLGDLSVDFYDDELEDLLPSQSRAHYQRNRKTVEKKILEVGYDPGLFGVLVVNRRQDGTLAVVDGGTRCRVLREMGFPLDSKVPCLISKWDIEHEVAMYLDWNTVRLGLSQVDRFIARVASKEPRAVDIENILRHETGWGIRPGQFQCVEAIENAYRVGKLTDILAFLREMGWLHQPKGKTQHMVRTLRFFFLLPNFDAKRAMEKWEGLTPERIMAASANQVFIAGQSRTVYKGAVLFLADRYNKGKRSAKTRLEVDFGSDDNGAED